jgi:hypothetical protein
VVGPALQVAAVEYPLDNVAPRLTRRFSPAAMVVVLLLALALTAVTVLAHGLVTPLVAVWFVAVVDERKVGIGRLRIGRPTVYLLCALLILHIAEAMLWAVVYLASGQLPDFSSAAYFSLTCYTTVGFGDITMDGPWRLLGAIEAAVGMLMFGWSTGLIVALLAREYRRFESSG